MRENIALIGMAGVGKSFVGKRLAERLSYSYVSGDELITKAATKSGVDKNLISEAEFMRLEERVMLNLAEREKVVIDTGGSVVYLPKAMKLLDKISYIIYLEDWLENIEKRYKDRGKVRLIGFSSAVSFQQLFNQRRPLYEKYAHDKIDLSKYSNIDQLIEKILERFNSPTHGR